MNAPEALAICRSKRPYKTESKALRAAARCAGRYNARQLRVYQCRECRRWHLTSQPRASRPGAADVGSTCRLYVDGIPQLQVGDYLRTDGGSVYEVVGIRPSPTITGRRYLRCIRTAPDAVLDGARVWPLHWYRRHPSRPTTIAELQRRAL